MLLSHHEWTEVSQISSVLGPFLGATEIFSGETYVTSSCVAPIWLKLIRIMEKTALLPDTTANVVELCNNLANGLEQRWPEVGSINTIGASFLDVNYKNLSFLASDADRLQAIEAVKQVALVHARNSPSAKNGSLSAAVASTTSVSLLDSDSEADEDEDASVAAMYNPVGRC